MVKSGTLYTCPNYFRSYRIEVAAEYGGCQLKKVLIDPGKTDQQPELKAVSPSGAIPAFKSDNGVALFETSAIASLVGGSSLTGGDCPVARAQVSQWCTWADQTVLPAAITWVMPCLGVSQYNKTASEKAREEVRLALTALNKHLETRTWLVGERVTQADITVACNLLLLYVHVLDPSFRESFDNVTRWFVTFVNQPEAAKVIGAVKLAEKMAQFDGKKYAELHPKVGTVAKKQVQPQEKVTKQAEKKPEPKPAADAPAASVDKDKDPFLKFPVGTWNMDEFKRTYSNKSIAESQQYFWEKLDKENYSIWRCEYLYPDELRLLFMSANLVSGLFQRLDRMRKHAFGVVGIFGENNNSTISGVWIWRGHELAFDLHEDLQVDYESYKWTKVDPNSAEGKAAVNEYFFFDQKSPNFNNIIDGKKVYEIKVYK